MASRLASHGADTSLRDVSHVFFDVGGTLLASTPTAAEIFRNALEKRGHVVSLDAVRRTLRSPELIATLIQPLPRAKEIEYFRTMNARLVEHLGFDADEVALDDIHASFEHEVIWKPYPEAVRALKALRAQGCALGVISNATHRLPQILRDTGLADHLDTVTYSFEIGAEKPHPRIFKAALARAGSEPESALMVGDSFEADYLGARRLGCHAVLLCREPARPGPCPSIRTLEDLPSLLGPRRSRL